MKNIVTATFQPGYTTAKVLGLWQYDYGQILRIQGLELPDAVEIHFSLQEKGGESERQVGLTRDGVTEVAIPNSYLENAGTSRDYSIYAFLYISDGKSGNTEYKITMYVQSRPEPKDPETPENPKDDPFGKTIEAVNKAMESTKASAEVAADSAKSASESATQAEKSAVESQESAKAAATSEKAAATSATATAESASQARESATAARSAADQAGKSATAAAESATTATQLAANAAQSATNASGSAESASQSAETAKTAAGAAEKSASVAQQAVRSAAESASTATAAAQTATTAAGKAAESATTANQSAETAGQKATAAETAASSAAESATEAGKSATAAGDSASAAKASETAAEEAAQTAQEQAERIKDSAEQIEKNRAGVAALEETKADKTTLAVAERKLDALWKLNQGVSYQFEEDSAEAYRKEIPSGAKLASVKQIGGKTIVWNQLVVATDNNINSNKYYGDWTITKNFTYKKGHSYLIKLYSSSTVEPYNCSIGYSKTNNGMFALDGMTYGKQKSGWKTYLFKPNDAKIENGETCFFAIRPVRYEVETNYKCEVKNLMVFDLTQMFGAGNEPSTVEAFEAMFLEESYSYNVGELLSAGVSEVVEQGKNLLNVSNITDIDVDGKGSIRKGVVIPVQKGTYKISALKAENNIFVKKVVGNNYATPADLSSKEVSLTFDANGSIYVYATDGKIEGVQVEKGSVVTQYSPYHKNTYPVSEAVRQLPGYGWSAGNVCNEVDFENKKYIQRVAAIDLGKTTFTQYDPANHTKHTWYAKVSNMRPASAKLTCAKYTPHSWISMNDKTFLQGIIQSHPSLSFIYISDDDYTNVSDFTKAANGVMLYYELAEPIITDISDIVGDTFQEPFEVEAGGTLTFQNSHDDDYRIPVSSTEEYLISLAEVAK